MPEDFSQYHPQQSFLGLPAPGTKLLILLLSIILTNLSAEIYWTYKTPYFIFVRDTLSYLALLGLHLAICLEPSQLSFSGLEWAILVFFVGRLLIENKQFKDAEESERERARKGKLKTLRSYLRYKGSFNSKNCHLKPFFHARCVKKREKSLKRPWNN